MNEELNAKAAEKVLGWTRIDDDLYLPNDSRAPSICSEDNRLHLPDFSGNIAYAWQVVERMREMGYGWCVNTLGRPIHCNFFLHEYGEVERRDNDAIADTAPEAICLAALSAKEDNGDAKG